MPYQPPQNIARDDAITAIRFPIRLLSLVCLLTLIAFVWFSWIIFDARRDAKMFTDRVSRIEKLRGIVVHLDEVLTMSARMAAATGDLQWERRYRQFEPQLDAAIKETTKIGTSSPDIRAATKTDEANIKLVEMENRAFALVRADRKEEARALLFNSEYEAQKKIYAEGIKSFSDQIRHEFDESLRADQRIDLFSMIAAMVVGGTSFVAWLSAARGVRRWRAQLLDSFHRRAEAEENLRKAHAELEVRVKERTADLAKTNETLQAEISERKRANAAQQSSEAHTKAIVQSSLDCIVTIDHKGKILEFNPAAEIVFGYPRAKVLGMELAEVIVPPSLRERHRQGMTRYLATGDAKVVGKRVEMVAMRSDGSEFPVELAITRLDAEGLPMFTGFIRDITQRKQAEDALRASEERYRSLFESNPNPMWVYDVETLSFLAVNGAAVEHYGYSQDEFLAMTIKDIRPAEDIPALMDDLSTANGDAKNSAQWRHCRKDRTMIDVEVTSHDLTWLGRRAKLALINDITERKRAEDRLRQQARLLDLAQDAIMVRDMDDRIEFWNHRRGRIIRLDRS